MNIVRGNCFKCEKPLEFTSDQNFGDWDVGDPNIPQMLNLSLEHNLIICGGCKSYNVYVYEDGVSSIRELNEEELNEIRR